MKITENEMKNLAISRYNRKHWLVIAAWSALVIGWALAWLIPYPVSVQDGVWTNLEPALIGLAGYLILAFSGLIVLQVKSGREVKKFMADNGHLVNKEL